MGQIDSAWFYEKLARNGMSLEDLARYMTMDPSAVSEMLGGDRRMSADEQDSLAAFLHLGLEEVAVRRRGKAAGFSEENHKPRSDLYEPSAEMFREKDIIYKDGKRWMESEDGVLLELHPIFGCMKGTMTIMPGVDLTAPIMWDEDWENTLYNE